MKPFVIGIDASNIRSGGGLTHLAGLLGSADPEKDLFARICIWGGKSTLDMLNGRPWLHKIWCPTLDQDLLRRVWWQTTQLGRLARNEQCDILFVPGSSFTTNFRPIVTISQNLLPFDLSELLRYGLSFTALRLLSLRLVQSLSFQRSSGVIFLTEYARRTVQQVTGRLPASTIIVPHGISPRFFSSESLDLPPMARMSSCQQLQDCVRLVYVSIVDQYKHQWLVVEAVAQLRIQTGADFRLDLVGPAYKPALRKLKDALKKYDPRGDWACYHGPLGYSFLPEVYARAHIGIFASSCENLPIILLEMMASRMPIISSNRGPMPEILGDAGLYFDPEQPDTLAQALLKLFESEVLRATLANAAYDKARLYSWSMCARRTFGFLREAAESHTVRMEAKACAE